MTAVLTVKSGLDPHMIMGWDGNGYGLDLPLVGMLASMAICLGGLVLLDITTLNQLGFGYRNSSSKDRIS